MSITSIEQSLEGSEQLLRQIHDYIRDQIQNTWLDKLPGVDIIVGTLEHLLDEAEGTLAGVDATIRQQIAPLIEQGIPNAIEGLVGIAQTIEHDVGTLLGEIATVDDVTGTVINAIRAQAPHLADWLYRNVVGQFGNVGLGVLETIEHERPELVDPILDELLTFKTLPKWLHDLVQEVRGKKAPLVAFLLPAIILAALLPTLGALGEPIVESVRQGAFSNLRTKELDVADIVTLYLRGQIKEKEFDDRLSHYGFNNDVANYMAAAARPLIDPETVTRAFLHGYVTADVWADTLKQRGFNQDQMQVQLKASFQLLSEEGIRQSFLRGLTKSEEHDHALAQYGYSADVAKRMRELYFYIPPVADLIHMGIRNVFVPELVERFTLDGDYPKAFEDAARQQGVSTDWAHKYWQSHWIMPGREAFFEMFQRTIDKPIDPHADEITLSDGSKVYNIMGRDTLNLALRDIDTPPFYRDKLTQVAYRPLTRIDIRRLAAMGLLTHANVERAYLDNGYSQHNARRLADFTDALTKKTKRDEVAALTDNLRKEVLRLFIADKMSEDEAVATLKEMDASQAEVDAYIAESKLIRRSELATIQEAGIGKLYMAGIINDKETIKRLRDSGVPDDAIFALMTKWNLAIEYRGGTEHLHKHKELTASEVEQALADNLISPDDAIQHFLDMGFDDASAKGKVSLTIYKSQRAAKNAQIAAIRASYVNGTIEELEASNRLDALLVPAMQRDGFLTTWGLERETRTERIPLATLRDMAQGSYITWEELMPHLKRHRFTDADAELIAKFWEKQKPPRNLVPAQ